MEYLILGLIVGDLWIITVQLDKIIQLLNKHGSNRKTSK